MNRYGAGQDQEWDDWGDTGRRGASRPGASRPGGPRSNPGYGYEDDQSRALVPQYGQAMPPAAEDEIVGLPGFPSTDEEERAMGFRRPAYIPATDEKRKRKLSSWRVVSGVLSIMLVCIAACAGAGFLGQNTLKNFFKGATTNIVNQPTVDLRQVPATPIATAGPSAKYITSIVTAEQIDTNSNPINVTSYFKEGATVYLVIRTLQTAEVNTVSCVYYLNGQNYKLPPQSTTTKTTANKATIVKMIVGPFLQQGIVTVNVYWNRPASDTSDSTSDPYLADTIRFAVLAELPTPTAGATTPTVTVPSNH